MAMLASYESKSRRRRLGEFDHVIHGTTDVMDSRHNSLFTFGSTATEKLENLNKFQSKSPKTYV